MGPLLIQCSNNFMKVLTFARHSVCKKLVSSWAGAHSGADGVHASMLAVTLPSIACTLIDVSTSRSITGQLKAGFAATHSRITRHCTKLLTATVIHGTWIDHIARSSIGGKLIARSTTAHSRDTSKCTDVVTATVVHGTWIRR